MLKIEYCIGRRGTEPYWVKDAVPSKVHARAVRNELGQLQQLILLNEADPVIAEALLASFQLTEADLSKLPHQENGVVLYPAQEADR